MKKMLTNLALSGLAALALSGCEEQGRLGGPSKEYELSERVNAVDYFGAEHVNVNDVTALTGKGADELESKVIKMETYLEVPFRNHAHGNYRIVYAKDEPKGDIYWFSAKRDAAYVGKTWEVGGSQRAGIDVEGNSVIYNIRDKGEFLR